MPLGSQQSNVEALTDIQGLVHEVFTQDVLPAVRWDSVTAQLMTTAGPGDYRYDGESLNGAIDLRRPHGAMATGGKLPDAMHQDAENWQTTPVRRYARGAVDNFVEAAAVRGPGSYADFGTRIFDQLWGAYSLMEIRHSVGGSDGVLCTVSSRTSSTVFVAQNGYGYAGANPLIMLEEGMVIAWHDASDSNNVKGAARIAALDYATNAVTVDSAATWEPGADDLAANDIIVAATTNDTTADYFDTEYQQAKNGLLDIVDPGATATTVFNISEATNPRWKPYRLTSSTFDHIEVTEFVRKHAAKSTMPVTAATHTMVGHPALVAELARSLIGFQQQQQMGKVLEGGYQTVRIAGQWDIAEDEYQVPDVLYNLCMEDLFTVSLVEAGYFEDDGSMYSRIADFDGKEFFTRDYGNSFSPRRNRHAALTAITLANVTASDFDPVPDY
jgi:hypothetical protein